MSESIADFLLARIADEEDVARSAAESGGVASRTGWQWWTSIKSTTPGGEVLGPRGSIEASPARMLAECAAKRAIVEAHRTYQETYEGKPGYWPMTYPEGAGQCAMCGYGDDWQAREFEPSEYPCWTLKTLAAVYADHHDFDPAWKLTA